MHIINPFKKLLAEKPLLLGMILLFTTAFFSTGYDFADEHFQILEIASYKAGNTPASTLPWEFHAQMRPGLQPALAFLMIKTCNFFNILSPFVIATLLRLLSAGLILFTINLLINAFSSDFSIQLSKSLLYTFFLFTWFLPYNFVRFSSENWSGMAFMLGLSIYLLERKQKNTNQLFFIGFLTGLSFVFRYQSAFMIAGLGLWMIIIGKENFKRIFLFAAGNMVAVLTGIMIDRWLYGNWVLTFWNYLDFNIIQDKVSEFGILPWWFYFENIFLRATPPIGLAIIASFLYMWIKHPKNILSWISIPFVLIHLFIGHKEVRFLYPLLLMIPLAFSVLISDLKANHKLNKILQNSIVKKTIYFVFGLNVMVLFIMCFKPADELISFYKVVYQKSLNKEVLLIVNGNENPWVRGGKNLPVSFYKSNSLTVLNIQEGIQINDSLLNNKDRIYLYAINNFDSRDAYVSKNIQFNKIYQTYPEWVERFNINNWMSRTKIRTIYEIKKNR